MVLDHNSTMANTKSAQKAIRSQAKKAANNAQKRKTFKDERKEVLKMIAQGDTSKASEKLSSFYKAVDKAAKNNAISKNAAARYKSRLVAKLAQPSK